jgi:hypothetical protein
MYVRLLFGTKQARWVLPSLGGMVSLVFNYALCVVWGAEDLECCAYEENIRKEYDVHL